MDDRDKIEGLKILEDAFRELKTYRYNFEKGIESGRIPQKPETDIEEIMVKYPRAAMYNKAQGYAWGSDYRKKAAGKKAMELIVNGGEIKEAEEILNSWLPEESIWN